MRYLFLAFVLICSPLVAEDKTATRKEFPEPGLIASQNYVTGQCHIHTGSSGDTVDLRDDWNHDRVESFDRLVDQVHGYELMSITSLSSEVGSAAECVTGAGHDDRAYFRVDC
mgnify:CR=1 FL=1